MTDAQRIAELEAEVAILRKAVSDQAAALAAHAEREKSEHARKEGRSRINRENYARRRAKMFSDADQTSDSDQIQTLNPPSPPLDGPPPLPAPISPSPLSSPHPPIAPAPADAVSEAVKTFQSDDFALEAQDSGPKPKKPSAGERLYLAFEASRQEHCAANGLPFVEQRWDAVKINTVLGKVAKVPKGALVNAEGRTEEQVRLEAAWKEYLSDPDGATREPAWSIGWFMSGGVRSRYESRALRAAS